MSSDRSLPEALLEADEQTLMDFDRQDRALAQRAGVLRLQRAALSLAALFERHPTLRQARLLRVNSLSGVDEEPDEPFFVLTNRGPCSFFRHSDWPLEDYSQDDCPDGPVEMDPDAGYCPSDAALTRALSGWIADNRAEALARLLHVRFERPKGDREPLAHAFIRQALPLDEFALWQAAALAREAQSPPSPTSSEPALGAPRL